MKKAICIIMTFILVISSALITAAAQKVTVSDARLSFDVWQGYGEVSVEIPDNFISSHPVNFTEFERLNINEKELDSEVYYVTKTDNSTTVTLKESYLKTLTPGEYYFSADFVNLKEVLLKLTIESKDSQDKKPDYDTSRVLVVIKKEYSGKGRTYYPAEFSEELVKEVVPLMYINDKNKDSPLINKENFRDIISLVLKEPSEENVELLLKKLKDNPLVESAEKNIYIYLDPVYLAGDTDGDEKLTAKDARIILRFSVGLENLKAEHPHQFDADCDGKVTAADARYALRTSIGLEFPHYYEYASA